jgi:intein-encoded DNA endonuclease-like protein
MVLLSKTNSNISFELKTIIKTLLSSSDKFKIIQLSFNQINLLKLYSTNKNISINNRNHYEILTILKDLNIHQINGKDICHIKYINLLFLLRQSNYRLSTFKETEGNLNSEI